MKFLLAFIFISYGLLFPSIGMAQRESYDLVFNNEDKEKFKDMKEAATKTSKEAQSAISDILSKWDFFSKYFAVLPKEVQDIYNKTNKAGFKRHLATVQKNLKNFDEGMDNFDANKEGLDNFLRYLDRYSPDSQNPFRSLEVFENAFSDLELLLPKEKKYEFINNTSVWLVRTALRYFKEGISQALGGLRQLQTKIKNRAGDCIGFVGGDGTADSSDPKRKAFVDKWDGLTVCYSGVRPEGGKIYIDETGAEAFLWDGTKWTKFDCGLGTVNQIFTAWKLAEGKVISSDNLVNWCNKQLTLYKKSKEYAQLEYGKLTNLTNCQDRILLEKDKATDLEVLLQSVNHDRNLFIAKYIFSNDDIKQRAHEISDLISNTYLYEGKVTDINDEPVSGATIHIETVAGDRTRISDAVGYFKCIMDIDEKHQISKKIKIKIQAQQYPEFKTDFKPYTKSCMDLGVFQLKSLGELTIAPQHSILKIGDEVDYTVFYSDGITESDITSQALDNTSFTATNTGDFTINASYKGLVATATILVDDDLKCTDTNEVWDEDMGACRCKDGFEKNTNDECIEIQHVDSTPLNCNDPNSQQEWDDILKKFVCRCKAGYVPNGVNGACIIDKNALLANADCAGVPGTIAYIDEITNQVICTCTDPLYSWDASRKECIPNIQAILDNSDCSEWPNTKPKWDYGNKEAYCDCIAGYKWDEDYEKCISTLEHQLSQADCSHYPNSVARIEESIGEIICECKPGYEWNDAETECISMLLSQLGDYDCSPYPNTHPIVDQATNEVFCDCFPGYKWRNDLKGCEQINNQQQNSPDCSHIANAEAILDPTNNTYYCKCQAGFEWNSDKTNCIAISTVKIENYNCDKFPNTTPVLDPVANKVYCECLPGYQWNRNRTACERIQKKPSINWGDVLTVAAGALDAYNTFNGSTNTINSSGFSSSGNSGTQSANNAPPVHHNSNCDSQQKAGGDAPEVHTINIGQSYGSFVFNYDVKQIKDQIIIMQGSKVIFNTGCISGTGSIPVKLSGFGSKISVRVNPNCSGGTSGTAWNFTVICPN